MRFCLKFLFLFLFIGTAMSKNVQVSNIIISNISNDDAVIYYDLSRTNPTISASQPVWIFVKYRLANETDFTGWKDTDDIDASDDASDTNTDIRAISVNANLSGDVGMVASDGTKSISWHWGGTGGIGLGTGLSSSQSVRVRIYAIEMALIPGGNVVFRQDSGYTYRTISGTTTKCGDDFYMMKYPVTVEMYKDFLNAAANRHDHYGVVNNLKDYFTRESYSGTVVSPTDTLRNMLYELDTTFGVLTLQDTVGINAVWGVYNGDGQGEIRSRYPMTHLSWYNCYDFSAWAGLSLLEEEHYYKVASENGQSNYYWGNSSPNTSLCNYRDSGFNHPTDVTMYENNVDATDNGPLYGVYELSGNVWEWTSTTADGYYPEGEYNPSKGPVSYNNSVSTILKKTARYFSPEDQLYAGIRYFGYINNRYAPSGFRCGYFGVN